MLRCNLDASRDLGLTMVFPFLMFFQACLLKNNPFCPPRMYEWFGRALFVILDPLVKYLGGCMTHCHSSGRKLEPASDKIVIAKGSDFQVYIHTDTHIYIYVYTTYNSYVYICIYTHIHRSLPSAATPPAPSRR